MPLKLYLLSFFKAYFCSILVSAAAFGVLSFIFAFVGDAENAWEEGAVAIALAFIFGVPFSLPSALVGGIAGYIFYRRQLFDRSCWLMAGLAAGIVSCAVFTFPHAIPMFLMGAVTASLLTRRFVCAGLSLKIP